MPTKQIKIRRFNVISAKSFDEVMAALAERIGHTPPAAIQRIHRTKNFEQFQKIINETVGPFGLMQFHKFDLGATIARDSSLRHFRIVRIILGNPLVMKELVSRIPDAGSYAPLTLLVSERADGVHLSYDLMTSCISPYKNKVGLKIARELDGRVTRMLTEAAC